MTKEQLRVMDELWAKVDSIRHAKSVVASTWQACADINVGQALVDSFAELSKQEDVAISAYVEYTRDCVNNPQFDEEPNDVVEVVLVFIDNNGEENHFTYQDSDVEGNLESAIENAILEAGLIDKPNLLLKVTAYRLPTGA